jgi:hypothetical protein
MGCDSGGLDVEPDKSDQLGLQALFAYCFVERNKTRVSLIAGCCFDASCMNVEVSEVVDDALRRAIVSRQLAFFNVDAGHCLEITKSYRVSTEGLINRLIGITDNESLGRTLASFQDSSDD